MRNKYNNIPTTIDEIRFSSKREAARYSELKMMKLDPGPNGVKTLILQPRFELQPSFKKDGRTWRKIEYVADFDVTYNSGKRELIDVKGFSTAIFKLKSKWFDYKYPDLTLVIEE